MNDLIYYASFNGFCCAAGFIVGLIGIAVFRRFGWFGRWGIPKFNGLVKPFVIITTVFTVLDLI